MSFEIKLISNAKGRGLIATQQIVKGEIIFEEKPLVCSQFLWNEFYRYAACEYCLYPLETVEENVRRLSGDSNISLPFPEMNIVDKSHHVPCPNCQVVYCSQNCFQNAWSEYHQLLCLGASRSDSERPLNILCEFWKNIHFPPESCSILLFAKLVAKLRLSPNKAEILERISQFCHSAVESESSLMHKLMGEQFQSQIEVLRQMCHEAFYCEEAAPWFTPDGFRGILALIGRNGQGVGTSSLSAWLKNCGQLDLPQIEQKRFDKVIDRIYEKCDEESGSFLNCEGSALYMLQSLCNHSCEPNADITFPFHNHMLVLVATKAISPGEEICVSYLSECDRDRSRHSRSKVLSENYLFHCHCSKCEAQKDDPDVTSEDDDDEEEDSNYEDDEDENEDDGMKQ